MVTNLLIWTFFGALAGWIAASVLITPRSPRAENGLEYIGVGILGAVLGGILFRTIGSAGPQEFNLIGLFIAIMFSTGTIAALYGTHGHHH